MSTKNQRIVCIKRKTKETDIELKLNLDGKGTSSINSPTHFLNHMLDQLARHGLFDLSIQANGDTQIDDHHLVEDIGIVLGQAFAQALGDKVGISRFASFYAPLDESLSRVVIDISGRGFLRYQVNFVRSKVGNFDLDLLHEFFQAFASNAHITIHIENLYGANAHHQAESIFKSFARALKNAVCYDAKFAGILPSTKDKL